MFTTDMIRLCSLMNRAGKQHRPFLFGINYELTEGFFIENPLEQQLIGFQFKGINNKESFRQIEENKKAILKSSPVDYAVYKKGFDVVQYHLQQNNSCLVNYTVKTPIELSLTLEEVFERSDSPYQLFVPGRFVCFSPERFVYIANGRISTNPMKGTINAAIPDAENIILNNFKEVDEHKQAVELSKNDLSKVAENIQVERYRYIDRIKTLNSEILQVSSEITGDLPGNYHESLGDIIFRLLPAGSISGTPKPAAMQVIREAETEKRGYYTGVFGYYDGETLDTAVFIRFIEEENGNYYFRSGGGVTIYSQCKDEYREVIEKIYLPFV